MAAPDTDIALSEKNHTLNSSFESTIFQKPNQMGEKRVLVIYASGAMGAEEELKSRHVKIRKGVVEEKLRSISYLCDLEYTQQYADNDLIITPLSEYKKRTAYRVLELEKIQNSRQITFQDIKEVASIIRDNSDRYGAFVIISGIATITYMGSVLSFLLENLQKTVILTGALVPLSFMRNDGFTNILDSLILAGHFTIPEVLIVMGSKGYRANCCRQLESDSFESIDSPNFPALVEFKVNIEIKWHLVLKRKEQVFADDDTKLSLAPDFVTDILVVKLTPFLSFDHFKHLVNTPNLRCLIVECYHFAEMPHYQELYDLLQEAQKKKDLLIITLTQCIRGQQSKTLDRVKDGIIIQIDITPESAIAKAGYLMGRGMSNDQIRNQFQHNLRGEIQSAQQYEKFDTKHQQFIQILSEHLQKKAGHDQITESMDFIYKYVIPNLGCYMCKTGQLELIKQLHEYQGDLGVPDFDNRAPLHLATAEDKVDIVKYLISEIKVDPNPIDYLGYSPMYDALVTKDKMLLFLFKENGGLIKAPYSQMVELILEAGHQGDEAMLECLYHGGVKDLNSYVDIEDRNVAHMAVFSGRVNVIKFLKFIARFDFTKKDIFGRTPLNDAVALKNGQFNIRNRDMEPAWEEIIKILS